MAQMPELAAHLRVLRTELVERMTRELEADRDIHSWFSLLADIHAAVEATEAVTEERTGPPRTQENASSRATKNASERP